MKMYEMDGGETERTSVVAMATNERVLSSVAPLWPKAGLNGRAGLLRSSYANIVAGWCVKHYLDHQTAPGGAGLAVMLEEWCAKQEDEPLMQLVKDLLGAISDEHHAKEHADTGLLLKMVEDHLNEVSLDKHSDEMVKARELKRALSDRVSMAKWEPICLERTTLTAADIEIEETRWLWDGWLARGELCMLDGVPSVGKSQLTMDLIAKVTKGWPMPGCEPGPRETRRKPANVVLLCNEDSRSKTIAPRLEAAGADRSRVILMNKEFGSFPADLPELESYFRENKPALFVVDPISSFIGDDKMDTNSDHHTRKFLMPVLGLAKKYEVAGLLVRHTRKDRSGTAMDSGMGSRAWGAFCRLGALVGRVEEGGPCVMASVKCNIGKTPRSMEYEITGESVLAANGKMVESSRILWTGEVDMTANELVKGEKQRGRPSQQDSVRDAIVAVLASNGGRMASVSLIQVVQDRTKVSERTYRTALSALQTDKVVAVSKDKGTGGKWTVVLMPKLDPTEGDGSSAD